MIADLAQTTGRDLQAHFAPPTDVKLPETSAAAGLTAMFADYDAHGFVGNANVLR
jgi:hypothetical protein